jgi:hypothetical protein
MEKRIIEAWGIHYPDVKSMLDSHGWYNGGNDKIQKKFDGLDMLVSSYHQIPKSLLVSNPMIVVEVEVEEEIIPVSKPKKKGKI